MLVIVNRPRCARMGTRFSNPVLADPVPGMFLGFFGLGVLLFLANVTSSDSYPNWIRIVFADTLHAACRHNVLRNQ